MSKNIPTTVSHDDFLKALEPLLELLGVGANEIYRGIHITSAGRGADAVALIDLTMVARAEGDDAEVPTGIRLANPPQEHEFAELGYCVTVEVI
jgi:hypothetical protein